MASYCGASVVTIDKDTVKKNEAMIEHMWSKG